MINPQFRSDHEPDCASSPHLHELQLLKPPSMHQIQSSSQRQQGPSAYNLWKKPKSSSAEASSEITHSFSLAAKNKLSGDLSCELGLGVGEHPRRVCRICQRHFSSGRALGGHMRVHGPLFQPAGSKRKLNSADLHGMSTFEDGFSEKEVGKVEPIMNSFTESAGEAVEDELDSETDVHEDDGNDGVDEYSMHSHREEPSSTSLEFAELVDDGHLASSKRNPLYKLRHNPKRSRRFAEDDFAMEMLLAEHGAGAIQRPRVCSECGKSFWSWKALFGHMRCHPEREWRGILPPEDSSVHEGRSQFGGKKPSSVSRFSESSDYELESDVENRVYGEEGGTRRASYESKEGALEEDEVTEEELAIMRRKIGEGDMYGQDSKEHGSGNGREDNWNPRWPPTGKRSRRKSTEGKAESLQQLSMYAHQEEPALTSESASLVELEEEHHVETPNFLLMLAEAARKIERDTAQVQKSLVQLHPDVMPQDKHEARAFNEKHSVAAASSTSGIVKFECSTCKKSFNSHQALGGHRASHRKMKGCFARTTLGADEMGFGEYDSTRDELSLRAAWQGVDAVQEKDYSHLAEKGKKQQTKGHECSVCHRMFSTGQALGGHKRCHYIGEKVLEAVSVTSSNKQLSEEGLSSKLDEGGSILDLNLPAPEDSEVACASAELRLFQGERDEREGNWTTQGNSEEISLAPWKVLGSQKSGSWELEGSWARGPAMAY